MAIASTVLNAPIQVGHDTGETGAVWSRDALLLQRFQQGDDAAFLELFQRHNPGLFRYCVKVLGNQSEAEDITQDTWEKIIQLRKGTQVVSNPSGLIFRMARNACISQLRRRGRWITVEEFDENALPLHAAESASELEEVALAALEELPFEYREVLVLHLYCGYRYDEIAVMMERTPEAIWARASRARGQLRKMVAAALGGGRGINNTQSSQSTPQSTIAKASHVGEQTNE